VSAQAACNKEWTGGSGKWEEASHWIPSGGAPSSSQSACITAPGPYTVTITTDAVAKTLTVGGASSAPTLDVVGASQSYQGNAYNETTLVAETMSFAANTKLILEATGGGNAKPTGGGGVVQAYTVTEAGQIETASSDPHMDNRIRVSNLQIEPGASLLDASGTLLFLKEGEGAYPWSVTNEGTFTVAAGAAANMEPSFSGKAGFINEAAVINDGSIVGSGAEWTQLAGSVSGNPVELQSPEKRSASLEDAAGTGAFLFNYGTVTLTGVIPSGQTVTVRGEPGDFGGEIYNSTTLSTGGKELVNDGTLVLNPTGSGETGGSVNVESGSIHNNGVIDDETETASRITQLDESLTNGPSGTLEVNGGIFQGNNGAVTTNEGLVTVAPGALVQLEEAASFVNTAGGTFSPQIASASGFGAVQLTGPCCNGPGIFTAGGTLKPVLVGGFVPSAGQEFDLFALDGGKFEGAFAAVGNGFTADYSHKASEPAFVGAVYGTPAGGAPGGGSTPKPKPRFVQVGSVSHKQGKPTVTLSCPAGGAACQVVSVQATVIEHLKGGRITAVSARKGKRKSTAKKKRVVVATGSVTLTAGASKTLVLTLNANGNALLKKYGKLTAIETVSSGGTTISTATVHWQKATKGKRK